MVCSSDLYVTPALKKKKNKIMKKLKTGAGVVGIYLLTLPSTKENQLEIINAAYLKQKYYRKRKIKVVGMAESWDQAVQLLIKIVEFVYAETGKTDIRTYLEQRTDEDKKK